MKYTAQQIIDALGLQPHPEEGGYFAETHRSLEMIPKGALPDRYDGDRCCGTAIYYLLTPDTFSHMHILKTDEIFHFYMGDPCEMVQLHPDGSGEIITFGSDILEGQTPQLLVPGGTWQGMWLKEGGEYALMGCTVSPGFEYVDYSHGSREELTRQYPDFSEAIRRLTT